MPTDDEHHEHEHHEHDHNGFAFQLPGFLVDAMTGADQEHHLRRQMHAQVAENEVMHFLDSLGVDQLLALRRILCIDNDSTSNNYFDGQIVSLLRVVHKVDITTGEPFDVSALEPTPVPPAPPAQP
jgi:hypothetical protein